MTRDPILDGPAPTKTFDPDKHCGAHPDSPKGPCCAVKGWGTDHKGTGRCRHHGGNTPSGRQYAQKQIAEAEARRFALPIEVDPSTALLQQVHALAGWVQWYEARVQAEGEDRIVGLGLDGERASPLVTLLMEHRKQLAAVATAAIRAGVEERRVKLAERQGDMLVSLIRAILDDLELTPGQQARVPDVVPRHLRAVGGVAGGAA